VDAQKDKIGYQKKHLNQLEEINKEAKQSYDDDIKETNDKINELKEKLDKYPDNLNNQLNSLRDVKDDLVSEKGKCNHNMQDLVRRAKFFENNDDCPTCTQEINKQLKNAMLIEVKDQAQKTQKNIDTNKTKYDSTIETLNDVRTKVKEVNDIASQLSTHNTTLTNLMSKQVNEVDMDKPTRDLVDMTYKLGELQETYNSATSDLLYNDVASEMLKDTGIRTKIIKEYLPAMNTLINKYLQVLEFFVAFNLDENFQETIKSRHRDTFVYDNFSEGEKMRIDLSLLFAWRQIAKMKNSTNTNLLILDETFDSSLDEDGVDNLMKILLTLEDGTNTFIISHKPDMLESRLKDKIVFVKKNNFSTIN
jgi:hypothetical protein